MYLSGTQTPTTTTRWKEEFPDIHTSILKAIFWSESGFYKSKTLFSDQDDGTVKHILRHLNGIKIWHERYVYWLFYQP